MYLLTPCPAESRSESFINLKKHPASSEYMIG